MIKIPKKKFDTFLLGLTWNHPFVTLQSTLSNYFWIKTCFKFQCSLKKFATVWALTILSFNFLTFCGREQKNAHNFSWRQFICIKICNFVIFTFPVSALFQHPFETGLWLKNLINQRKTKTFFYFTLLCNCCLYLCLLSRRFLITGQSGIMDVLVILFIYIKNILYYYLYI